MVHSPSSSIAISIDRSTFVSVIGLEKGQGLIGFQVQIGEGHVLASQTRVGSPRTYPCPNDEPIVSAFQLLVKGVLTNHELVDYRQVVCSVYSFGGATTMPALR